MFAHAYATLLVFFVFGSYHSRCCGVFIFFGFSSSSLVSLIWKKWIRNKCSSDFIRSLVLRAFILNFVSLRGILSFKKFAWYDSLTSREYTRNMRKSREKLFHEIFNGTFSDDGEEWLTELISPSEKCNFPFSALIASSICNTVVLKPLVISKLNILNNFLVYYSCKKKLINWFINSRRS